MKSAFLRIVILFIITTACAAIGLPGAQNDSGGNYVPVLAELSGMPQSEMREILQRYASDRAGFFRFWNVDFSKSRRERARAFYGEWRSALEQVRFDALGPDGRIDHILFRNRLANEIRQLDREARLLAEAAALIPFLDAIIELQESRRSMKPLVPSKAAARVTEIDRMVKNTHKAVEAGLKPPEPAKKETEPKPDPGPPAAEKEPAPIKTTINIAYRASKVVDSLERTLKQWFDYYNGYDPQFTWWVADPNAKLTESLKAYRKLLREKIVGFKEGQDDPIVGDPIGKDELLADLAFEMIPYTPEELVEIANREFAWCEREMLRASRELGHGDDWKAALEHVKNLHVEAGKQPDLIRDQALEAIAFLETRDLVTIPQLAKDIWRIEMMSPERQKVNPFFLGGEVIQVSFPTHTMTHEEKMMSMRGNNIHFSRATVQHELIPGHHLQGFMNQRYNTHRSVFATPFWTEGWALYWEMLLWDLDFPETPENRIGMLFWRMHRCARIIFSLGFHLGTMTPQQCIDFLVERVGHERKNAEGEVRRSFEGTYPPLYQIAYMIGGLQFRALHAETVGAGRMTNREFHDAILRMNRIPVEMVRARLLGQSLPRDFRSSWRF